jgi:hypothetical protein
VANAVIKARSDKEYCGENDGEGEQEGECRKARMREKARMRREKARVAALEADPSAAHRNCLASLARGNRCDNV